MKRHSKSSVGLKDSSVFVAASAFAAFSTFAAFAVTMLLLTGRSATVARGGRGREAWFLGGHGGLGLLAAAGAGGQQTGGGEEKGDAGTLHGLKRC